MAGMAVLSQGSIRSISPSPSGFHCARRQSLGGSELPCAEQQQWHGLRCDGLKLFHRSAPSPRARRGPRVAVQKGSQAVALLSLPSLFNNNQVPLGPFQVAPLGLGTWAWGNQLLWGYREDEDAELQRVFDLAVRKGVRLFDTADSYGTGRLEGQSERLLGRFMRECPDLAPGRWPPSSPVVIATKFATYPWRLTTGQFVGACKASASRLGVEAVPLGQLHWSASNYAPFQERVLWDSLVALYDQGLVKSVGVSNYGPKQLQRIHKYLEKRGVPMASAQVQYSLLSCGPPQDEMLSVCRDLGLSVIAYSPLGLGLLTGKYSVDRLPSGPRGLLFRQLLPGLGPLQARMEGVARERGKSVVQVALNWCICKGTIPIPGARTIRQVEDNLGALGWRLSSAEVKELDEIAQRLPKAMVQNIFQTA